MVTCIYIFLRLYMLPKYTLLIMMLAFSKRFFFKKAHFLCYKLSSSRFFKEVNTMMMIKKRIEKWSTFCVTYLFFPPVSQESCLIIFFALLRAQKRPFSVDLSFYQVGSWIFFSRSHYYCHCHSTQDHMQASISPFILILLYSLCRCPHSLNAFLHPLVSSDQVIFYIQMQKCYHYIISSSGVCTTVPIKVNFEEIY